MIAIFNLTSSSRSKYYMETSPLKFVVTISYGKNPRTLQLANAFGDGQTLQLDQSQKIFIPRSWLLSNSNEPIAKLSDENGRLLASWLASRYKRAPFPDSFVNRLRYAKTIDHKELNNARANADRNLCKQLEAYFSLAGAPIEGVYVGLSGNEKNELDATTAYILKLALVARSGPASEEEIRRKRASEFAATIGGLIERVIWSPEKGEICLKECTPLTEKDFSLYQLNRMLRWHLDWLSATDEGDPP